VPFVKKANREYDKERDQTEERQFIHSTIWRKIRDAKLARDPLCEKCLKRGIDRAAIIVHHKDGNELNNMDENLESLCNLCHEEKHKEDRWGGER
jgi:5-methylcytosine-specific restriction protein A